jgi:uncharacterized membrane protein
MPAWALALTYFLHLSATIIWLGSLVALALIVIPAARKLELKPQTELLNNIQTRLESVSWFCMFLLLTTGMFQMSGDKNYIGLVSTENAWSMTLLVKHLLAIVVVFTSGAMTWGVLPALRRAIIRYQRTGETEEIIKLRKRENILLNLNLFLAFLILVATATAQSF